MFKMTVKVKRCNQCEACMINGVFCHETGCPNINKRYFDGEGWLSVRECKECGSEVLGDDTCCESEEANVQECPVCGVLCNNDVTIADHGKCYDCHYYPETELNETEE